MPTESDVYLHGHHDSVLRSHRWRTAENSAGYLIPHLAAGAEILDIGCGPGTITAGLAELASGKLSARVAGARNDEVGRAIQAFNNMAGQLQQNRDRLPESSK